MKARLPDGYGKQNVNELMKQAQLMQDQIQTRQAELEETEYTVKGPGNMVEVTMRGDYQVTAVHLEKDAVDPEDVEMLEDVVAAAFNEAVRVVKESSEQALSAISERFPGLGGLSL